MQVTNTVTFSGQLIDIGETTGNIHKYVRVEPNWWIWAGSVFAQVDPGIPIDTLEELYKEFIA